MKVKKVLLLLLALTLIIAAVSGMFATDTVEGRSRNVITTGKVDISLKESTTEKNVVTRENGIDFSDILPGQSVNKTVTVTNGEEKCWLRVKVDISVTPQPTDGSQPSALIVPNIDKDNWRYEDGYYYYKTPLDAGDTVTVFDTVLFAPTLGNAYAGSKAGMAITAEATQYKNNETMAPESWPAGTEGGV